MVAIARSFIISYFYSIVFFYVVGYVNEINGMACARVSCALGAGRAQQTDIIDHAVGLELKVAVGSYVEKGKKKSSSNTGLFNELCI